MTDRRLIKLLLKRMIASEYLRRVTWCLTVRYSVSKMRCSAPSPFSIASAYRSEGKQKIVRPHTGKILYGSGTSRQLATAPVRSDGRLVCPVRVQPRRSHIHLLYYSILRTSSDAALLGIGCTAPLLPPGSIRLSRMIFARTYCRYEGRMVVRPWMHEIKESRFRSSHQPWFVCPSSLDLFSHS